MDDKVSISRKEWSATVGYRHFMLSYSSQFIPFWLQSLNNYHRPTVFCMFAADCWFMVLSQTPICVESFHHPFTCRMSIMNIGHNDCPSLFFVLKIRCSTRRPPSVSTTTSASPLPSFPSPNTILEDIISP